MLWLSPWDEMTFNWAPCCWMGKPLHALGPLLQKDFEVLNFVSMFIKHQQCMILAGGEGRGSQFDNLLLSKKPGGFSTNPAKPVEQESPLIPNQVPFSNFPSSPSLCLEAINPYLRLLNSTLNSISLLHWIKSSLPFLTNVHCNFSLTRLKMWAMF